VRSSGHEGAAVSYGDPPLREKGAVARGFRSSVLRLFCVHVVQALSLLKM